MDLEHSEKPAGRTHFLSSSSSSLSSSISEPWEAAVVVAMADCLLRRRGLCRRQCPPLPPCCLPSLFSSSSSVAEHGRSHPSLHDHRRLLSLFPDGLFCSVSFNLPHLPRFIPRSSSIFSAPLLSLLSSSPPTTPPPPPISFPSAAVDLHRRLLLPSPPHTSPPNPLSLRRRPLLPNAGNTATSLPSLFSTLFLFVAKRHRPRRRSSPYLSLFSCDRRRLLVAVVCRSTMAGSWAFHLSGFSFLLPPRRLSVFLSPAPLPSSSLPSPPPPNIAVGPGSSSSPPLPSTAAAP